MNKFIESSGFEYRSDYHGMPDHISVEFEFMAEVSKQEAEAWEEEDRDRARHCLKIEKRFLNEHLIQWVPLFCDQVINEAGLSFYGEMARLAKSFIEFEGVEIEKQLYLTFENDNYAARVMTRR